MGTGGRSSHDGAEPGDPAALFSSPSGRARDERWGARIAMGVVSPFVAFGVFLVYVGFTGWMEGEPFARRPGMFLLGLALVLLAPIAAAVGRRIASWHAEMELRIERAADRPWQLQSSARGQGLIVSDSSKEPRQAWMVTAVWAPVAVGVALILPGVIRKSPGDAWFLALAPAIGVLLVLWAARMSLRQAYFGESAFEPAVVPLSLGGAVEGLLHVSSAVCRSGKLLARVVCDEPSDSQKNGRTILWSTRQELVFDGVQPSPRGIGIPLHIPLPHDAPPSNPLPKVRRSGVRWLLEFEGAHGWPRYRESFTLPVFATKHGDPSQTRARLAESANSRPGEAERPEHRGRHGLRLLGTPDGAVELWVPPVRSFGITLLSMGMCALFSAISWGTWEDDPFFCVAFGAGAGLLLFSIVVMWLGWTRIHANPAQLVLERRILGWPRRTVISSERIARILVEADSPSFWYLRIEPTKPGDAGWAQPRGWRVQGRGKLEERQVVERVAGAISRALQLEPNDRSSRP